MHAFFNLVREHHFVFFFPAGLCLVIEKTRPKYWAIKRKVKKKAEKHALEREKTSDVLWLNWRPYGTIQALLDKTKNWPKIQDKMMYVNTLINALEILIPPVLQYYWLDDRRQID